MTMTGGGKPNEAGLTPKQEVPDDVRARILALLANGMSLREVCRIEGMPERSAFNRDLLSDETLQNQYARACEIRAEVIFDEILEIADDGQNDWMERNGDGDTGFQLNGEHVQRSRLRLDARKWALAKMNPKKYGDKVAIGGADDLPPIQTEEVTRDAEDFASRMAKLAARHAASGNGETDPGSEGGA